VPIYNAAECDVLEAMTTAGFEFAREVAYAEGIDLGLAVLGDQAEGPPAVIVLQLPPGHVLERHAHDSYRVEIVVKGSVILPDGRELLPGDVSTAGLVPIPAEDSDRSAGIADWVKASLGDGAR
jgi:hypothetical protein